MMNRKSKLKINKGEEFKIAIKNINDGDTIFYDQYKQALKMLDDIIETSKKKIRIKIVMMNGKGKIMRIILLHFVGKEEKEKVVLCLLL